MHRGTSPRYYPNLVVVSSSEPRETLAQIQALASVLSRPGWSIKDSFSSLDLSAHRFRSLFEASWIWLDPPSPTERRASRNIRWSRVASPAELARWTVAWSGDGPGSEPADQPPQFPPVLLADPEIALFYAHDDRHIVGGGIANRAAGVVGLSNVFVGADAIDAVDIWSGLMPLAGAAFPDLPVVGYAHGDSLEVAASCGFKPIGPLRVWMRDG
jgi:hypothetical protein